MPSSPLPGEKALARHQQRRIATGFSSRSAHVLILAWAAFALTALTLHLETRPLYDPDEGRGAEVMREMVSSGDFFVPRLNGLLFLDKPFLNYAAGALAMSALGETELAARLPSFLFVLLAAGLVGWFGDRQIGRGGWFAGLALAAAPLVGVFSQVVIFDAMLMFWIVLATVAGYGSVEGDPGSAWRWSHLSWLAMRLGSLTKGPVALLVPLAALIPFAIWRRRPGRLVRTGGPLSLLAVVLPWCLLVLKQDPDFLRYVLLTETWGRLTTDELQRNGPLWYYLPYGLMGGLPWSVTLIAGWRRIQEGVAARNPIVVFLLAWIVVPFLIFSIISSKRPHYILPLIPAVVLLSLWVWLKTPPGAALPGARATASLWLFLGLLLLLVGSGLLPLGRVPDGVDPGTWRATLVGIGLAAVGGGGGALWGHRAILPTFCSLSFPFLAVLLFSGPLFVQLGAARSAQGVARAARDRLSPNQDIAAIEWFYPSLPFYLGRVVPLASVDAKPLRSNYIRRRYDLMVSNAGGLRSPEWLGATLANPGKVAWLVIGPTKKEGRAALDEWGWCCVYEDTEGALYGRCPEAHSANRGAR